MQAEQAASGIMKTGDFGDCVFYKVSCQCHNSDDDIDFEVEANEYEIVVNTTFTPKSDYWNRLVEPYRRPSISNSFLFSVDTGIRSLINGLYHRLKVTKEVWLNGYVKMYQSTIMTEQQSLNYATALISAIDKVKEFRDNKKYNDSHENEGC